jgi:hypothetical protein
MGMFPIKKWVIWRLKPEGEQELLLPKGLSQNPKVKERAMWG